MEAKLTRMSHKIEIELHLVAESFGSFRPRRPVLKLLDTSSYCLRPLEHLDRGFESR
jgi:hypothetical protein